MGDSSDNNMEDTADSESWDHAQNGGQSKGTVAAPVCKVLTFSDPLETQIINCSPVSVQDESGESLPWPIIVRTRRKSTEEDEEEEAVENARRNAPRASPGPNASIASTIRAMQEEIANSTAHRPRHQSVDAELNDPWADDSNSDNTEAQSLVLQVSNTVRATKGRPVGSPTPLKAQDGYAVSVRKTGARRGLGVFVNHDFPNKQTVLLEDPAIVCKHFRTTRRKFHTTIAKEWLKLSQAKKLELRKSFRKLAAISLGATLTHADKKLLENFVLEYAFRDIASTNNAYIFELACHINHACVACANCTAWVDPIEPNRITIKLQKPVDAGDELFLDYGTPRPFKCAVCNPSRLRRAWTAVDCTY